MIRNREEELEFIQMYLKWIDLESSDSKADLNMLKSIYNRLIDASLILEVRINSTDELRFWNYKEEL